MILLSPDQRAQTAAWFLPEQPGRLVGSHILHTGHGAVFADRWPDPRAVLAGTAGSYVLLGDAQALSTGDLQRQVHGSVAAAEGFAPTLKTAFPNLSVGEKAVLVLAQPPGLPPPSGCHLRRLASADAYHLWGLSPQSTWITRSWGGPDGLLAAGQRANGQAASGQAWGAFIGARLASVACGYYLGQTYVDVAVTTEPEYRRAGLSSACAAALCCEILATGRRPIWNTALDNPASLRVAEKLGFAWVKTYPLYSCQ